MSITVTIAGSSYTYPDSTTTDWADMATSAVQAICNNAVWTADVVNNLTSTSATAPLAANQGRVLEDGKLSASDLDDTPANDAETAVTSKWVFDNIYNASYDSGWFTLSDYTNASETITHSLSVAFKDLSYRILYSATGVDGTDNVDVTNVIYYDFFGVAIYGGQWCKAGADNNSVVLRTAQDGGANLTTSGGIALITSGSYRIIVRKNIFK